MKILSIGQFYNADRSAGDFVFQLLRILVRQHDVSFVPAPT
jgi:hypothetical protein